MTGKDVQFPRGETANEDGVVGLQGQVRVDTSRNELRLHDGITPGGFRIPNIEAIQQILTSQSDSGGTGDVVLYASTSELADAQPSSSQLAILTESGAEDIFVWRSGGGDDGTITSGVDGHWHRVDSALGFIIRMWRAGLINLQIGGAKPTASKDSTAWLNAGALFLYDGADYAAATPALFMRLFAGTGGFYTSGLSFPDRIAEVLIEGEMDLNDVVESGWFKTNVAATNAPVAGVHLLEHRQLSSTVAWQQFWVMANTDLTNYTRFKTASVWSSWTVNGVLPDRLEATSPVVTDANSAVESGTYQALSTATHLPLAVDGSLFVSRISATDITQVFVAKAVVGAVYTRSSIASTWTAWIQSSRYIGEIIELAGTTLPPGCLYPAGQSVLRASYPALFAEIGTTYGSVDGTHFTLPDKRGRVAAGKDNMGGSSANRLVTSLAGGTLGTVGGEEYHTLTTAELAVHAHADTLNDPGHVHNLPGGVPVANAGTTAIGLAGSDSTFFNATNSATTGMSINHVNAGSGTAHNNIPPTIVVNFAIFAGQ